MGPRRYRRGSLRDTTCATGVVQLQWGRDVTVADRVRVVRDGAALGDASMGPRRYRRGSPTGSRLCAKLSGRSFNGAATLPSRIVSKRLSRRLRKIKMLQWGRDVTVADRTSESY